MKKINIGKGLCVISKRVGDAGRILLGKPTKQEKEYKKHIQANREEIINLKKELKEFKESDTLAWDQVGFEQNQNEKLHTRCEELCRMIRLLQTDMSHDELCSYISQINEEIADDVKFYEIVFGD